MNGSADTTEVKVSLENKLMLRILESILRIIGSSIKIAVFPEFSGTIILRAFFLGICVIWGIVDDWHDLLTLACFLGFGWQFVWGFWGYLFDFVVID